MESNNITYGKIELSPKIVQAIQNDKQLIELYKKLRELQSKAIPTVIQVSKTEFKATFGDDYNETVAKFQEMITFRIEQILSFYKDDIR